jgi:hypothetical protein
MPRPVRDDDDENEDEDFEEGLPEGVYYNEDEPTVTCPHCGREVIEDSPRCPHCESHLSREDMPARPRSWFWAVMMALALLVALWWVVR